MMKSFKNIVVVLFALVLVGCSATPVQTTGETVTVSTEKGEVEVPKNPKKVVTFDFAVIDFLMATEVDIEEIGAVASSAPNYQQDYLASAKEIGSLKGPDLEKIAEIEPDVIFIGGRTIDFYDQLSEIAPVVYLTVDNTDLINSIKTNSNVYATIFDQQEKTDEIISTIDSLIESIEPTDSNALVLMYNEGQLSNFGPGSRFGFIFDLFGYQPVDSNIEVSSHGVEVSYEYIAQNKPDRLFVVNRNLIHGGNVDIDTFYTNPLLKDLNLDVVELDPNAIYQAAGGVLSIQTTLNEILDAQ